MWEILKENLITEKRIHTTIFSKDHTQALMPIKDKNFEIPSEILFNLKKKSEYMIFNPILSIALILQSLTSKWQ